jgi:hypothetical protein
MMDIINRIFCVVPKKGDEHSGKCTNCTGCMQLMKVIDDSVVMLYNSEQYLYYMHIMRADIDLSS